MNRAVADLPVDAARARALEELGALAEDLGGVLALLDPAAAMAAAADRVRSEVGLPVGMVGEAQGGAIVLRHFSGVRGEALHDLVVPAGLGLGGRVLALGRPYAVDDYPTNPSITHQFDEEISSEDLHPLAGVPIARGDTFHGVLYGGARTTAPLADVTLERLDAIGRQTAVALEVCSRTRQATAIAVAEERRRLALELHDSVGAMLFVIGAGARDLADATEELPELTRRAREIQHRAADAAAALRRSLSALHTAPPELALGVALQADCQAFTQRTAVPARTVVLTDLPDVAEAVSAALLSAVREALLNIEKHAGANSVAVTAAATAEGIAVAVADDGRGLAAPVRSLLDPAAGGLGLEAAAVRLARIGGTLNLVDNDEGGVTVRAWVPR